MIIERNFREKKKGQFRTVLFCIALTLATRLLLLRDTTQRTITPPRFARKVLISPRGGAPPSKGGYARARLITTRTITL